MNLLNATNVWQADNLPDGLSINNGVISGVPTTRGTYNVPVTVSNALGSSTSNITIIVKRSDDCKILVNGVETEQITPAELVASIQDGTAQTKYNCTNTQITVPFTHPLNGTVSEVALNFCAFKTFTLQDASTKTGLILQFATPLWKGFAPFSTNGFNRWRYSQLREWLNSDTLIWFIPSYANDVLTAHEGSYTDNGVKGFLCCFPSTLREAILSVKVTTEAFFDDYNNDPAIDDPDYIDGRDADVTYDKVFLPSLSEMGLVNDSFEGTAWTFYSSLNANSPIFTDMNSDSCSLVTRSAYLEGTDKIYSVSSNLTPAISNVYSTDAATAPAFVLG